MAFDLYTRLRKDVKDLQRQRIEQDSRTERAEFAGAVPAFTLATAPTTGVGDNLSYTSVVWISNARKPTEGVGAGTGILCIWDATSNQWLRVGDYTAAAI